MRITISRRAFMQGAAAAMVVAPAVASEGGFAQAPTFNVPLEGIEPYPTKTTLYLLDEAGHILGQTDQVTMIELACAEPWESSINFEVGQFAITKTGMADRIRLVYDGLEFESSLANGKVAVQAGDDARFDDGIDLTAGLS